MLTSNNYPRHGEGAWSWFIKIVTGGLIVIILGIHFIVNHMTGSIEGGLLSWEEVVRYFQNPLIPAMEIAFVIFAVSHSLIGLRSIILDMNPSRSTVKVINWLFTIIGLAAIVYGIWLAMAIVAAGSAL